MNDLRQCDECEREFPRDQLTPVGLCWCCQTDICDECLEKEDRGVR